MKIERGEVLFVLEHTSLRDDGKARKEENTSINKKRLVGRISSKP